MPEVWKTRYLILFILEIMAQELKQCRHNAYYLNILIFNSQKKSVGMEFLVQNKFPPCIHRCHYGDYSPVYMMNRQNAHHTVSFFNLMPFCDTICINHQVILGKQNIFFKSYNPFFISVIFFRYSTFTNASLACELLRIYFIRSGSSLTFIGTTVAPSDHAAKYWITVLIWLCEIVAILSSGSIPLLL